MLWQLTASHLDCCCWLTAKDEADENRSLFGVRLASETHLNDRRFDTRLGVILLGSDWSDLLLPAIRLEICQQLHTDSKSFTFITPEGFVNHLLLIFMSMCIKE